MCQVYQWWIRSLGRAVLNSLLWMILNFYYKDRIKFQHLRWMRLLIYKPCLFAAQSWRMSNFTTSTWNLKYTFDISFFNRKMNLFTNNQVKKTFSIIYNSRIPDYSEKDIPVNIFPFYSIMLYMNSGTYQEDGAYYIHTIKYFCWKMLTTVTTINYRFINQLQQNKIL